jgi:MFS family permease
MAEIEALTSRGESIGEWRRGWPVVMASSIGLGTAESMLLMTASLFIKPMQADLGWSVSDLTFVTIVTFFLALGMPIAGALTDRWGGRAVAICGVLLFATGLVALAFMPPIRLALFSIAIFIGLIAALSAPAPFTKCVATWFDRNAGGAFGVTMSGPSLVALAAVPLVSAAIHNFGWRSGYLVLAGLVLLCGFPMILLFLRERPGVTEQSTGDSAPGYSLGVVLRDFRFWSILVGVGIAGMPLGGYMAHLQPMLFDARVDIVTATSLGVVFAVSISIGRLAGGFLMDRLFDGGVALGLMLLAATGGYLLAQADSNSSVISLFIAVLLVGMGQGAEADFVAYFALRLFGLKAYSKIVGLFGMVTTMGLAIGAWVYAKLYDSHGNYHLAFIFGAACFIVGGIIIFLTRASDRIKWRRSYSSQLRESGRMQGSFRRSW